MGQKFRQNRSILLRFRDKGVFAFKSEIQDGCQKWRGNDFCEKSPVHSADTLWVKNFVEIALSRSVTEILCVFAFNAEIQDGHQKWRENDFCGKCHQYTLLIPCVSKKLSKVLYLAPFLR